MLGRGEALDTHHHAFSVRFRDVHRRLKFKCDTVNGLNTVEAEIKLSGRSDASLEATTPYRLQLASISFLI